jgi:hypothetical protein
MKRPFASKKTYPAKIGDIKSDFGPEQLAGIGAVAMNYNELEAEIFALFMFATGLNPNLSLEVFTRINGVDGIVEIIKKGANLLGITTPVQTELNDALGKGIFGLLKQYRDAVVHARAYNAPLGVGIRVGRQAALFEVLLTKEALEILYEHISALRLELRDATYVLLSEQKIKERMSDDPERELYESARAMSSARFLEHRQKRQSLRPLPEFPSELQLQQARDNWWQEQTAWQMPSMQPLAQPQPRRSSPAQTTLTEPPHS